MDRLLTKEQVELLRAGLLASEWCGYVKRPMVNALCDMALQSLSQEAVRDEVLDEGFAQGKKAAVKVCEECRVLILGDPTAKQGAVMIARETGRDLARQIEALKREPNAAAQVGQVKIPAPSNEGPADGPAPAAPDVANALQAISRADEVVFNAAIVANDRMRYEEAKNHRKLCDVLKEAAALLTKLGQGWEHPVAIVPAGYVYITAGAKGVYTHTDKSDWFYVFPLPPAPGASDD